MNLFLELEHCVVRGPGIAERIRLQSSSRVRPWLAMEDAAAAARENVTIVAIRYQSGEFVRKAEMTLVGPPPG